ncbi:MAG: hypothetical protein GY787_13165 [Alteromonadales bacterium]|nr:hypothetical protein [Alteromonadales bacterium]
MGKIIQADSFHGQTMFLNWRGYHSSTSNGVFYDSGFSTTIAYPYATIVPPFKGCVNKVSITSNPYSSFQSGPTGTSATIRVLVNGTEVHSETVSYTANVPSNVVSFELEENADFNANDRVQVCFQANGTWRYYNVGIQLMEII